MRGATYDFFSACDFWTLKRDSCIKRYLSGVCPSPTGKPRRVFHCADAGHPKNALGFLGPQRQGPQTQAFSGRRLPAPPNRKTSRGVRRRMPQFRKGQSGNPAGRPPGSRNRATSMVQNLLEGAAENISFRGGAEHACCRACYVPVRGRRDSLFVNPFQKVTKALL